MRKIRQSRQSEYQISEGKLGGNGIFNGVVVFSAIAMVVSCLVVIFTVIGVPTTMNLISGLFNKVQVQQQIVHQAPPEAPFKDVSLDSKYYDSLAYLKKNGVINGYEDNTFRPDQEMRRAELLQLIVSAKRQFPLILNHNSCFADVKSQWFAPAVCLGKEKKWVNGYEDNTFKPDQLLSKAEALKILLVAFDLGRKTSGDFTTYSDVAEDAWYKPYIEIALDNGLLSEDVRNVKFNYDVKVSRGYIAQLLYRILLLQ